MHNINSARLIFFISQILYHSVDYCQRNAVQDDVYIERGQFLLAKIGAMVSFQVGTMLVFIILLIGIYGFISYFIFRRASFLLQILEYFALPVCFLLISEQSAQNVFTVKFITLRILPIIIIAILVHIKILFIRYLHNQQKFNQLMQADSHYNMLLAVRIKLLFILSNYVTDEVLIYFLFFFQLISSFYKVFVMIYYYPQTQWGAIVTEMWGWISLFQFILKINLYPFQVLYLLIFVLAYFYFHPSPKLLIILQSKMQRILQKQKKQRKNQYFIHLAVYYIDTQMESQYRYLHKHWSNGFKLFIKLKICDKDYKISEYFQQMHKQKSIANAIHLQNQTQLFIRHNKSDDNNILREEQLMKLEQFQFYIKEKQIGGSNAKYSFEDIFFICYLLTQIQLIKPVNVYEMYYHLLVQERKKNNIFTEISLEILYSLIKKKIAVKQYSGTYIEQILKFDQFHHLLQIYTKNEQKFYNLTNQTQIDVQKYRVYLDKKIKLKEKLKKSLKILEFMYPNSQGLVLKKYIIERYINNNQFLSQESLMNEMNKIYSKKTKIINFSQSLLDNQLSIFLTSFIQNKGSIMFYNKNFQKALQIKGNADFKIKDILPSYWRDIHEDKLLHLYNLELNYEHDEQKIYYVQSFQSHKYMQAKQLKIIPYFELNSSLYLLAKMRIDGEKQLKIKEVNKNNMLKSFKNANLGTNQQGRANHTTKLDKNSQLSQVNISKNKIRSKHQIAFKHEIFDDDQHNTVDQSQKIIQIFQKEYIVCTRTKCLNFYTRNLLESSVEDKINEEINAVIRMGLVKKNFQTQIFQRSKLQTNLFVDRFWSFVIKIFGLCMILTASVIGIGNGFKVYNGIISQSILLEIHFHEAFVVSVSFQQVLIHLERTFPDNTSYQLFLSELYVIDTQKIQDIFDQYNSFFSNIVEMKVFTKTLLDQYLAVDFDSLYEKGPNNKQILSHISKYNFLLDSSAEIIRKKMLTNQTDEAMNAWILNHFQAIIGNLGKYYYKEDYIENIVISKSKNILAAKIAQFQIIYWFCEIFIIACPPLILIIYLRNKSYTQRVLCKSLDISQKQRFIFKQNYKEINEYIQKQQYNYENNDNKITQYTESYYVGQTNQMMGTLNRFPSNNANLNTFSTTPQQNKTKKNRFINFYHIVFFAFAFHFMLLFLTNRYLYLSKSQYIVNLSSQLESYKKFTDVNNQVLNMYQQLLQVFQDSNMTASQKINKKKSIFTIKQYVNSIDISKTIDEMLIDPSLKNQILFVDPCSWNTLCQKFGRKISPYPVQLNYFLSNFYKLSFYLFEDNPYTDPQVQYLLYETYFSIRSLVQQNNRISTKNQQSIHQKFQQQDLWITLTYIGLVGVFFIMGLESLRLLYIGKKYGRQLLMILPSSAFCSSKVFSFEVNCILYRTNFAKDLPHV